jgi:hypothetical protein
MNPPRCEVCGVVGGMAMNVCGHATPAPVVLLGCVFLTDNDDLCGDLGNHWRPANIPVAKFEWFCRAHAIQIAQEAGVYGIYNINSRDVVEEIPDA